MAGMLVGLWVGISPWFLSLQAYGGNATASDLIAGLAVLALAVSAVTGRGPPCLQPASALAGIWLIISPFATPGEPLRTCISIWRASGMSEQNMEHDDRNADIRSDLEIITNSMHMLPPWVPAAGRGGPAWWSRFGEFDQSYSLRQLAGDLAEIMEVLDPDARAPGHRIHSACIYVLKFFDIPALYEHLDEIAAWQPAVPGRAGIRWSETICSAAWRVLVATEPYGMHARDRFVPPS